MFAENVYSVYVRLERFYSPRRHKPDFNTEHNGSLKGKEKKIAVSLRAFTAGRTRTIARQTGVNPWFFTIMYKIITLVIQYFYTGVRWRRIWYWTRGRFDETVDGNINWTVDVWNLRRAPSGTRSELAGTYSPEALK